MPRVQLRLVAALAALVALTALGSAFVAERGLRNEERARIERSLEQRARLTASLLQDATFAPAEAEALGRTVRRAHELTGARVTLIAPDGAVVADSDVSVAGLPGLDNHGARPEVRAALAGERGASTRWSRTVGRELLYLAVPHARGAPHGVVRLAVGLSEVDEAVATLRSQLMLATAVGLAAAVGLAYLLSGLLLRPLERMRLTLQRIEAGDLSARVAWRSDDELGEIAYAIDRVAAELEARLGEISAEHGQLQAVLRGMLDGVLLLDGKSRIELANAPLRRIFGLQGDVEGRTLLETIRHAEIQDLIEQAQTRDEPVLGEVAIETPRSRLLQVQATRLVGGSGERFVVAVFHDLTDLRRAETMRRDFVANASHEIRTPLTAIRGFTETLLGQEHSREDTLRYLRIVLAHAERLGELVDDLLELSRIESGSLDLRVETLEPGAVARTLVRQQEPRLAERRIEARVLDEGAPEAEGDPRALEQVLLNLLDNALKYTEPGGKIDVRVAADDAHVIVEVADTGIGIRRADQARIFERFYRVDKARTREQGGTGLGLSIVKHLVHAMGGEIALQSTPGQGSTFRFTLPRAGSRSSGGSGV